MCVLERKNEKKPGYSSEMGTLGFEPCFVSPEPLFAQLLERGFEESLIHDIFMETGARNMGQLLEVLE